MAVVALGTFFSSDAEAGCRYDCDTDINCIADPTVWFVDCSLCPTCDECGCDPEDCTDIIDNDYDGLPDCADPECFGDPACPAPPSLPETNCGDGIDNDLDWAIDCADADCNGVLPFCPLAIPSGASEMNCTDGIDNDGDGPIDCADSDCVADPNCVAAAGGGPGAGAPVPAPDLLPIVQCGGWLDDGVTRQPACTLCNLFEMISRIINLVIIYGFVIGGMMLVVGGIMMYFRGSSPRMLTGAKSMVKNVIIGIIVMLVSYLIVFTVIHVLSGGDADTMFNLKSGGFIIECTD